MDHPRTILIKRRRVGTAGAPSSLNNGELAFNEIDETLYYGKGDDGSGIATNIIAIAGGFNSLIKDASVETLSNNVSASDDYLLITVNGSRKAIRLFDFTL
jgi:hypothetical protein